MKVRDEKWASGTSFALHWYHREGFRVVSRPASTSRVAARPVFARPRIVRSRQTRRRRHDVLLVHFVARGWDYAAGVRDESSSVARSLRSDCTRHLGSADSSFIPGTLGPIRRRLLSLIPRRYLYVSRIYVLRFARYSLLTRSKNISNLWQ